MSAAIIAHWIQPGNFPLCDLEATGKKSKNYQLLRDYVVWFANR
ncbi:MAG: hypothetical protein JMDDDDMK_03223 [Acidobacteria bacterium]|nr:hypothetical protein [Acidobacteriota bacterium]